MKKGCIFAIGVITGFFLFCLLFGGYFYFQENNSENGATYFDKPEDIEVAKSFKVIRVTDKSEAFVYSDLKNANVFFGTEYLITNDEGKYYYDDEIIKVPEDKVVKQFGVYKGYSKTYPIIKIVDR